VTDEILTALDSLDEEDREMMVEALAVAARKWRKDAAMARALHELDEIDRRMINALTAREGEDKP
jgi:hypothetical protein